MRPPFYRTINHSKNNGSRHVVSVILAIFAREAINRLKPAPEAKVVKVNNSKMMLYPKRGDINTDLYLYRKREPICTEYLINSGIIQRNDVVLDIGANIGYYALVESKLVGENGRVYAVEPVKSTYNLLKKNIELNKSKNISTYNYAFGDKNSDSNIYVSSKSNLCAMTREATGGKIITVQEVKVLTVDEFVKDKPPPTLVRMDVEGYEYEVIKGMTQTLKGKTKILLELHPNMLGFESKKLDELLQTLQDNNYRIKFLVYEHKVRENSITRALLKRAGDKMPIIGFDMSIQQLRENLKRYRSLKEAPNIYLEKIEKKEKIVG
jgi:FkbM family methyltransferase